LNPSNHFSYRNGLIEALVLTEEPQISDALVRILIQLSTRRALRKCFPKNTATVQKSEPQRKVLWFFLQEGEEKRLKTPYLLPYSEVDLYF
jgi:hypothetical protein